MVFTERCRVYVPATLLVRAVLACALVAAPAACSKKAALAPRHPGTFVIAVAQEPRSLNPLYLEGPLAYAIGELSYSYLTNYDSHGDVVADAAAAVPTFANGGIARDGRRITYRLRRDILWQDGVPMSAKDVAFSYRAVMNPANAIPSRYPYERIASVSAPDPYTVVVRLKRPYSPMVTNFFGGDSNYPILPAHLLANYPNLNRIAYDAAPIGSGPYRLVKWARGDRLDAVAYERYYGGKPGLKRVSLHFVHDSSTVIDELLTGEADATFFADVSQIATLRKIPGRRIVVTPVPYFYALAFNVTDPILKDVAVRRAFALAVDRRTLVEKAAHGLYDADTGMRGLFTWAFDPHANALPYDPRRAAALLARDGWAIGPGGVRFKGGRRLELQLDFYNGSDIASEFVPMIAAQARAAGIDVSTRGYSREEFRARDGPLVRGTFQIALYSYQSAFDPDAAWLLACSQREPNGFNDARYCNPAVDRALQRGVTAYGRNARRRTYRFVQRQLLADMPYAFLCQVSEVDVIPTRLKGYARPLLSPYVSIARWRW
jgi:peptide/nickel transport system substrate-binding protein